MTLLALEPWEPGSDTVLRSAVEHRLREAGARFERRGDWQVAAAIAGEDERLGNVAFTDASQLGKIEVRGGAAPAESPECAVIEVGPERWIVLCDWERREEVVAELGGADHRLVLDMSGAWTLLLLAGPGAERLLRRLGPLAELPGAGAIAAVPGRVTRRGELFWVLVPVEYAQHVWDFCADLCEGLEGGPAGLDAVARLAEDPLLVAP